MSRALAVLLALLAVLPATAAAQQATTLADLPNESPVSAYGDLTVVSVFDPADRLFHLTLVRAGAAPERLPVAPYGEPFDADLGPDGDGRPAVVFSRCDSLASTSLRGCDVAIHRLGQRGEQPIRNVNTGLADETQPSLWRGGIAWIRAYGGRRPVVYTRPLASSRTRRSERRPGLSTRNCSVLGEPGDCTTTRRDITDVELYGRRLAVLGTYVVARQAGFLTNELRLVDLRSNRARTVDSGVAGLGGQRLIGPSFSAGRLGWHLSCFGDPDGCGGRGAFRFRYTTGTYEGEGVRRALSGFALHGDGAYAVDGRRELGDPAGGDAAGRGACDDPRTAAVEATCPLVRFTGLRWRSTAPRAKLGG